MADKKVRIIITGKDDTKKALASVSSGFKSVGKSLLGLGAKLTAGVTLPIVGLATAAGKAAIDYESAFAGVIKTTDGLIDATGELTVAGKELNQGFRDLAKEIPLAASELAGIGEIAGQLGVPKEDILDFTRTIADIGVTTNLSLEGAASDFARFANIVGMPLENVGRLGATVVELGNNLATTEAELVDMAMRIAGVGAVVGLTEPQILGWGAAMSSVGLRAEAGGTAISRVFADIAAAVASGGEDLEKFARASGLSVDEFSKLFKTDASAAMLAFVSGLGEIQEEGGNVLGVLEDLSLADVRVRDTLLRLAGAGPLVAEALGIANKGWEENIALTKEAEQRYSTNASKLAILKNTAVDLGITFGELILPVLQDVVNWLGPIITRFSEMDEGGQRLILMGGALLAAIGPIVTIAGILATANYMIGIPGETSEDTEQTLALNEELEPDDFGYFVFYPYPGTRLFQVCQDEGFLPDNYPDLPANNRQSILNLPTLSKDDIEHYYRLLTRIREAHYMNQYGSALNDEQKALAARNIRVSAEMG